MEVKLAIGLGIKDGTKRIDMSDKLWEVEIERINTEVQLCKQKLDIIETNHLVHIQKDLDKLNRILWIVGFGVFTQLIYALRALIM